MALAVLKETDGIVEYHRRFELIKAKFNLPEEYLLGPYLAGLKVDAKKHIESFHPKSVSDCYVLGKFYERAIKLQESLRMVEQAPQTKSICRNQETDEKEIIQTRREPVLVEESIQETELKEEDAIGEVTLAESIPRIDVILGTKIQVTQETYAIHDTNSSMEIMVYKKASTPHQVISDLEPCLQFCKGSNDVSLKVVFYTLQCQYDIAKGEVNAHKLFDLMPLNPEKYRKEKRLFPKGWKFKFKKKLFKKKGYEHFVDNGSGKNNIVVVHLKDYQIVRMGLYAVLMLIFAEKNNHYEFGVLSLKKMSFPERWEEKQVIASSILRVDEFPMHEEDVNVSSEVEVGQSTIFALMDQSEAELGEALTRFLHLGLEPLYLGKHECVVEATTEVSKTFDEKIKKYCDLTLPSCVHAGTGDDLEVQDLLTQCGKHLEKGVIYQGLTVIGLVMVAMSAELGRDIEIRPLERVRTDSSTYVVRVEDDDGIEKREESNDLIHVEDSAKKNNSGVEIDVDLTNPICKGLSIDVSSSVEMNHRNGETRLQQIGKRERKRSRYFSLEYKTNFSFKARKGNMESAESSQVRVAE